MSRGPYTVYRAHQQAFSGASSRNGSVFSYFPFQPSGWVDHNVLRFRVDGEQVEVAGKSNLLMKSDTGTVWIYHVPESRVKGIAESVDITCSGDLDLLMHPERQKNN